MGSFVALVLAVSMTAGAAAPLTAQSPEFDFGADSGSFTNDGECDDVRFEGEAMAQVLLTDEIGRDASDCSSAFEDGSISANPLFVRPADTSEIIFGDDASDFSRDGECDDVRFVHADSDRAIYLADDIGHDATDCQLGMETGELTWQGDLANPVRGRSASELIASFED
jgi:hypothetical protein